MSAVYDDAIAVAPAVVSVAMIMLSTLLMMKITKLMTDSFSSVLVLGLVYGVVVDVAN